jgi:hypothetical protein
VKYEGVYAWAIEYERCDQRFVAFVRNNGLQDDIAYAEQKAAQLHGVLIPLVIDRRNHDGEATT